MLLQLGNFLKGRLAGPVAAGDTAITLASATFPTLLVDHVFYAVLQSAADRSRKEIVKVVGVAGTTIMVQRAQEGTAALSFAANDLCEQRLTAAQFQYVADHVTDLVPHVPAFVAGDVGKVLKAAANGYPAWGTLAPADVGALPISGGTLTGPLGVQTIQGQGASTTWGSLDVRGVKGTYSGLNFPDIGYWFGVNTTGVSGVFDSAGNPKWYFEANGQLGGGATVLWSSVTNHPSRTNWASTGVVHVVAGQLAWKNYGNGHTIFDASAGTSPDGTAVDKNNAQIAWKANDANYPTLMGWNGANTYGVRVDSARFADSAKRAAQSDRATYLNGTVATSGQDIIIHAKRAIVGVRDSNQLTINYANDWGSTLIQGQTYLQTVESNRHVAIHNGSTVYGDSGLEVRTTDGSDARIGFHRSGHSAGSINHNAGGFQFERESGGGSRANVAAANFFADAAQDMSGNALTRLDYVGANFLKYRNRLHPDDGTTLDTINREYGFNCGTGGGSFGPYMSFGGLGGGYECQITAAYAGNGSEIKFRTRNGDAGFYNPWHSFWNTGNLDPIAKNTGNVLNNSGFGVGFLSSGDSGQQWIAGYFGKNGGTNQVVVGEINGGAVIGGHNAAKNAWADLYIGTAPGTGGNNVTHISMPHARVAGNATSYEVLHRGNFNPDSKLSNNGSGGTLYLSNWFRSTGATGWYNETYGGGLWMDESTTVKVYGGKKFYSANTEYNAIAATGGIFSYQRFSVDTRAAVGNGNSFNSFRYTDAPFHAGFGGLNPGSFAPIVGAAHYINGQGYITRIQFGALTPMGAGWSSAALMVGSAENDAQPIAVYLFGADGHLSGLNYLTLAVNANIGNDMICSYAYANGAQPQVPNALTRKDYVDDRDWATRWETKQVPVHGDGNANSHYNSEWDGANVANAPSANWLFFRELYHSGGANWRHQEAFEFHADEEWFRRGQNSAGDYGPWRRRWHSGNFDPALKADLSGATFTGNISVPLINGLGLRYESVGNTVAVRDSDGDLAVRLLRPDYGNQSDMYGAIAFRGAAAGDNYLRFCSEPSAVRDWIGAPSTAVATNATSGLMSASDKIKLDNIQRSRSTQETTLWSGEAGSSTSTITISKSLYNYNAIRYQGTNADRTICWTLTMPAHEWAAQVATGKAVSIGAGSYYFVFAAPGLNSTTLTRHANNCYLTEIVGLK